MNRLIIIGNGFDLAHGLKTSYSDFLLDYFSNCVNIFYGKGSYKDELIEITITNKFFSGFRRHPMPITTENVISEIEKIKKHSEFDFKIISELIDRTYLKLSELNWVDLETEYFEILVKINDRGTNVKKFDFVDQLNSQLEYIKTKLTAYLILQEQNTKDNPYNELLVGCFTQLMLKKEMLIHDIEDKKEPEKLFFLNFNYTDILMPYIKKSHKFIGSDYCYIHGDLEGQYGNPIFGFGDELNKKYISFEDENNNSLFKHIKSFEYLQTKNFYDLTRFIDSNVFQAHIYGHSCGLSDRTLLNQIFESSNCKSIKVFYHKREDGSTDFTEKTYEISRHFKDKTLLRKKLVPFDLSEAMPQPLKQ